ncbi:MAG: dicarboxylate/amino acid:cation symporter [gamma proteobacterium symbiont of Bathyaustriella thionipta]|nr:dicarboxylate/amino acid:cation symporter [gamma proteobacterium symbiont of Bathyaustriella thionipta]MCU7950991.1 dicarboxylate/amino acid:cation symporter [gamma proteobacterium symbiont of Bathyaustriella thionipta]MCU7951808.1 dicarboxylate/amino acid:cation symporter [gamma proteobacterium symbiont of Bathyaustriella thionipta]MCU7957493.1 dicarboxylate/amino acid:cation symporter [gamma proteobacterium symbiont of Bathyaustriella thionipta]MCU7967335.1 dicarboxylate/amino acid:cation 
MFQFIQRHSTLNKLVMLGIILGIIFGIVLPEIALQQKVIGSAFVSLLKMLVVPLVFASIFAAVSGLGTLEQLKNIGIKTILLYVLTTALSVLLAIIVMNIFDIGEVVSAQGLEYKKAAEVGEFSAEAMFLSFIPTNIFKALSTGDLMKVIIFGVLLGIATLFLEKKEHTLLLDFATAVTNAMLKIAEWIIKLTPLGVFSLISYVVAEQGIDVIIGLWKYILVVLLVLVIHGLLTLPLVLSVFAKINPYYYLKAIREVSLMAFSTASSAATLPVSMKVAQEKGGVRKESAAFVLPLGATVSMDGTAAYLTIAVMYIANLSGFVLGFGDQVLLGVTVVALSVGVAALPSASLVMMVVILNEIGLSVEYLALIVAVDRILDMARTSLNVTSDMVVTKIVDINSK